MKKNHYKTARLLLEKGIHPLFLQVEAKLIKPLLREYWEWLERSEIFKSFPLRKAKMSQDDEQRLIAESLIKFICQRLAQELAKIVARHDQYVDFNQHYSKAFKIEEKRRLILEFAKLLGASYWQLRGDKKAFSRWFGQDAIVERYQRIQSISTRRLAFYLQRLGILIDSGLSENKQAVALWQRLNLENTLLPLLNYTRDNRVRFEAFHCLATALKKLPSALQKDSVTPDTLQYIYRTSVDYEQNVWIQCEAIKLLESFSPESLKYVLQKRFEAPGGGDDLFVRKQAVQVLGQNFQKLPDLVELIDKVAKDSSPFVRQALAKALTMAPVDQIQTHLPQLVLKDEIAQVRAASLLEIPHLLNRPELNSFLLQLLIDCLAKETDPFILRVAFKVAVEACQILLENTDWTIIEPESESSVQQWQKTLLKQIEKIHASHQESSVRRWAAQTAEQLWCDMEPHTRMLHKHLQQQLHHLKPEQRRNLAKKPLQTDDNTLARVLSVLAQKNFGYDIIQNWFSKTIIRGHLFGFRMWRLKHEILHPSPDKRQAFRHTVGRHFPGQLRIPSNILCEVAETKVPGEPLYIQNEGGWRPYLPLVDEILSCLPHREVKIYTSEGVTTLKPPKFLLRRLMARVSLTRHFAHYAKLRNWHEQSQIPARAYIEALQKLGFKIDYQTHTYPELLEFKADPLVQRFFPLMLPFGDVSDIKEFWLHIQEYFFSVYQNNILQLGLFAAAALAYFFVRHLMANLLLNHARAHIPLVIGGWGTRGKSGTERLKAAIFNALGYSIFSKTSGCEAMFLHANAFDTTHEMFLFRPYDKATIWEHHNVLRLAYKMDKDIFLWECMGLTPSYVKILQKQWTRDDISTITNTYPDHEDLQGPAGINVPQVMINFIPHQAILVSSEEQMLPILQAGATELNTRLRPVTWLQAGLLTPDILLRFPYEEHPYNIALVLALSDELGIPADFALKEMVDRVVPDLGVLKTYPVAPILSRQLEFVMGMSANERFGCLSNWERMEFYKQNPETEPHIRISTVVNNRADRIARSRVFANILVNDISVDQHFLIGTNLTGLLGYIREAWESYASQQTLWEKIEQPQKNALACLQKAAHTFRIPITKEHIQARLRIMLNSQGSFPNLEDLLNLWQQPRKLLYETLSGTIEIEPDNATAILQYLEQDVKIYDAYQAFARRIENATESQHQMLDTNFRQLLWQWFENKLVVIHNPHISGNQIIKRICALTPPGFHNRIMGMQNIKGTGLDFVYRWQAWETCYHAANKLKSHHLRIAEEGLDTLVSFREYGPLTVEYLHQTINQVKETPIGQLAHFQASFTSILSNLQRSTIDIETSVDEKDNHSSNLFQKFIGLVEAFLDDNDAIKRRKLANQIYKDMATERISHQTAALELQKLNKRQKGGWLMEKIQNGLRWLNRKNLAV